MIVGEAVVRYTADASGLVQGTNQAVHALNGLNTAALKSVTGLQRIAEVAAGIGVYQAVTKATVAVVNFARESVQAAARIEEMDKALASIGRNAGQTTGQIHTQTEAIKKMGIETDVAQRTLADFMRFGLQAADASKVARVAQDAAVISGVNSSQALESILYGITTRQTEVIRNAGVTVNLEAAFQLAAAAKNKTTSALTENEKTQAALNAVLKEGATLEGTYESSMESASKQLRSRVRYISELKESIGTMGAPLFSSWVFGMNDLIKMTGETFSPSGAISKTITGMTTVVGVRMAGMWQNLRTGFDTFVANGGLDRIGETLKSTVQSFSGSGGVLAGGLATALTAGGGGLASMLSTGAIGQFLPQVAGFALPPGLAQAAGIMTTLIVSSKEFRDSMMELVGAIGGGLLKIVQAFAPVTQAINRLALSIAPAAAKIVSDFAKIITQLADFAAALIPAMAPLVELVGAVIQPIISAISVLVSALEKSKIAVIALGAAMALWVGGKIVSQIIMMAGAYRNLAAAIALARTAETLGGKGQAIGMGLQSAAGSMGRGAGFVGRFGGLLAGGTAAGGGTATAGAIGSMGAVAAAAAPAAAVAAVLVAGVVAWKLYSDAQENARRKSYELVKQQIDSKAVLSDGTTDLSRQIVEWKRLSDASTQAAESARNTVNTLAQANASMGPSSDGTQVAENNEKMAAQQEIIDRETKQRQALQDYYKNNILPAEQEYAAKSVATARDRVNKVNDSAKLLAAQLGQAPEAFSQIGDLLPAQAKLITDQLNQMIEYTKSWRLEMQSGASAMKEAWSIAQNSAKLSGGPANLTNDLFTGVYTNRAVQVTMFTSDIDKLMNIAGDKANALVTELEKAGPQQVGDALHSWMKGISSRTNEEAQAAVNSILDASAAISTAADKAMRDLATKMMAGDVLDKNNPDSMRQFVTDYQSMGKDMTANQAILTNASTSGYFKSSSPIATESKKLNEMIAGGASVEDIKVQATYLNGIARASSNLNGEQGTLAKTLADTTESINLQIGALRKYESTYAGIAGNTKEQQALITENQGKKIGMQSLLSLASNAGQQSASGGGRTKEAKQAGKDLEVMISGMGSDTLTELFNKFKEADFSPVTDAGKEAGKALVAGIMSEIGSLDSNLATALAAAAPKLNTGGIAEIQASLSAQTDSLKSANDELQTYKNGLEAVRHNWDTLKSAVDTVVSRQSGLVSGQTGVGNASQKMAESLVTNVVAGRDLSQAHRDVADSTNSAMQAIKSNVMAMAEARVIGRDYNSIQEEMDKQIAEFKNTLMEDTALWYKNNAAKVAAQSVTEELAKTSGIMNNAIKANDSAATASVQAQVRLAQAIGTIPKNAREAAETQISLNSSLIAATDAIEQQAYALAASGQIGKDTQSIYTYITTAVQSLIEVLKDQTDTVLTADEALKVYQDTWDAVVGRAYSVEEAQWGVDDAIRSLTKTYMDYTGVATSGNVTPDAQSYAWQQLGQSVYGVVEALRTQAQALVKTGELSGQPGAISAWINAQLQQVKATRPVLAGEIDKYIAQIDTIKPVVDTQMEVMTNAATTQLADYIDNVNSVPPDKNTKMNVLVDEAMQIISDFKQTLRMIPDEVVYIDAVYRADEAIAALNNQFGDAMTKITQFQNALTFMQGGGHYASADAYGALVGAALAGASIDFSKIRIAESWMPSSVVNHAQGAVTEDHSPQIARGGSWRVFAEPETGGEAYIPLSIAKRPRSEHLLRQVASMFGGEYVPNADGNVHTLGTAQWNTTFPASNAMTSATGSFFKNATDSMARRFTPQLEMAKKVADAISKLGAQSEGSYRGFAPDTANQILVEASKYVGTPYLWGGNGLDGIDCSGFTKAVMQAVGIQISRTTLTQMREGIGIKPEGVSPGDAIFFGDDPNNNEGQHTGLVIDANKRLMVDASQGAVGIHSWDGYGNILGYRRYYADGAVMTPDHVRTYDSGGILKPGYTMAYNGTGKDEYVTTSDGQGPGGSTTIEQLHVHTNLPPQEWLDEAQWRRSKGSGL